MTSRVVDREPKIDIAFDIEEGPQTLVADVQVTGNQNIPYRQLAAPKGFQVRPGTPFSSRKLAEDRNRISATYLNRGYLNAEVKVSVSRSEDDPHQVDVAYTITEHQLVRIRDVVYLGQKRTRLSPIQKTAQLPARDTDAAGTDAQIREPAI